MCFVTHRQAPCRWSDCASNCWRHPCLRWHLLIARYFGLTIRLIFLFFWYGLTVLQSLPVLNFELQSARYHCVLSKLVNPGRPTLFPCRFLNVWGLAVKNELKWRNNFFGIFKIDWQRICECDKYINHGKLVHYYIIVPCDVCILAWLAYQWKLQDWCLGNRQRAAFCSA